MDGHLRLSLSLGAFVHFSPFSKASIGSATLAFVIGRIRCGLSDLAAWVLVRYRTAFRRASSPEGASVVNRWREHPQFGETFPAEVGDHEESSIAHRTRLPHGLYPSPRKAVPCPHRERERIQGGIVGNGGAHVVQMVPSLSFALICFALCSQSARLVDGPTSQPAFLRAVD